MFTDDTNKQNEQTKTASGSEASLPCFSNGSFFDLLNKFYFWFKMDGKGHYYDCVS